jgi:hypothetical protein
LLRVQERLPSLLTIDLHQNTDFPAHSMMQSRRIEAFLALYFLALMTEALIERDFRDQMPKLDINRLPLYPEERPCAAPTTERLFELFADLRRHRLVDDTGRVHQRFCDKLNDPQLTVLRLFSISARNISPPPRSRPPHELRS